MSAGNDEQDTTAILGALAKALLGQPLTLTPRELAKRTGIPVELSAARWRTMGYPEVSDDDVVFTKLDVESLKAVEKILGWELIDEATEEAFIRTVGRTFSRLAEWQVRVILQPVLDAEAGQLAGDDVRRLGEILELGAKVQETVWRHHLFAAATRLVLQYATAGESAPACAGFVDIVGFTSRSRSLTGSELETLVDHFESVVSDLVAEHGGRVVKTIGDEVLFVVDDPVEAAWLGVELAEQHALDPAFPEVRVGMALGDLLHRLGDVLGPVVNLASRLTSAAPAGRVIIDSAMAERVNGTAGLRVRKMRRVSMKGLDPVEPWSLKLAREDRRSGLRGAVEGLLEDASEDLAIRRPQRGA